MDEKAATDGDSAEPQDRARKRRRMGGASAGRVKGALTQLEWQLPHHIDHPVEPLFEEGVQAIHNTAMDILEEIGVKFLNDEALDIFRKHGCKVEEEVVFLGRDFVMEQVGKIPSQFTLTPRNPAKTIPVSPKTMVVGQVGSPPAASCLDRGKRTGHSEDTYNFIRLAHHFNCIHFISGWPVEPVDLDPKIRYLVGTAEKLKLTDKVIHAYSLGSERVEDALELQRIASGVSPEEFAQTPRLFTNINSTSPLKHDWPMIDGAIRFARKGQPTVISPFTLAGAMAPITLAGAVAQQTAECLVAAVLLQLVRPGLPVVFGAFTTNVDMKSGAPAFGTPEYMRSMQMSGQMARFYDIPWRGSNTNAANFPDAQAAWESTFSLWGVTTGAANMVYHGAGWMEGGLTASYEKFIIDCELLQNVFAYMKPVTVDKDSLAMEAIREVRHDGHFFGAAHTQERYTTEFYQPFLSDWRNHGNWIEAGSPKTHEAANRLWKQALEEYEQPPMDEAISEEIDAFVARRVAEGGVPVDF